MHLFSGTRRLIKGLAARSLAGFIRAVKKTSHTIHEPPDLVATLSAHVPFIMAMWHGQFVMLADLNTQEFGVQAVISRHGDAELVAAVLEQFGISAIRGAGAGKRKKNRGGAYALRAALRALTGGSIVAMTADVPVSQARTAGHGIVTLARLSGRPIIPVAAATSRFLVLNTWSKFTINLPFSTLAVIASDPLFVAPDADDKELERMRLAVEIAEYCYRAGLRARPIRVIACSSCRARHSAARVSGGKRPIGIHIVRSDPNDAAQEQDDEERNRPDDDLDTTGIDESGLVACPGVGGPKPPREGKHCNDRGHDDHQHDP